MSYDISIAKSKPYSDRFEEISISEWEDIIEKDISLERRNEAVGINPVTKEKIVMSTPNSAVYKMVKKTGFLKKKTQEFWLTYSDSGVIKWSYTNDEDLSLIKATFQKYGLFLYGEEGEEY